MIKRLKVTVEGLDANPLVIPLTVCTTRREYDDEYYKPHPEANPNYDVIGAADFDSLMALIAESILDSIGTYCQDYEVFRWPELISISEALRRQRIAQAIVWHIDAATPEQAAEQFINQHVEGK